MYSGWVYRRVGWYACVSNMSSVDSPGRQGRQVVTIKVVSSDGFYDPERREILRSAVTVSKIVLIFLFLRGCKLFFEIYLYKTTG